MSTYTEDQRKVTTHRLSEMKQRGEKIAMLTAYDYSMAKLIDEAGMDVILVGDSASNVMAGNITTLPITLDQMTHVERPLIAFWKEIHRAVYRGVVTRKSGVLVLLGLLHNARRMGKRGFSVRLDCGPRHEAGLDLNVAKSRLPQRTPTGVGDNLQGFLVLYPRHRIVGVQGLQPRVDVVIGNPGIGKDFPC